MRVLERIIYPVNPFMACFVAAATRARKLSLPALAVTFACAAFIVAACALTSWKSTLGRNHPLTGRIWDVSAAGFIDRQSLIAFSASADFLLLGEKHDNPDHHRLQAHVLRGLIAVGRRPAVGFEMFDTDDTAAIANHLAVAPNDAAGLGRVVNWNARGWPDWAMYQPIAEVALEAKLPIVATNLPLAAVREMRRHDPAALEPPMGGKERAAQLPETVFTQMAADIRASHCGHGSAEGVQAMVRVQRARDARMAQSLIAASGSNGAVLVAGAGHVRNDYGIPLILATTAADKRTVSIAFMEVDERKREAQDYAGAYPNQRLPFDYVWFTPRVDDEDPCETFKSRIERLQKAQ
jgi:uncharacterized iron-regulated protein